MALILAVNPGSTQSATLARVARQLHGHELIGADSCAVAMKAIEQRMPALVLLPSTATKGERELLQRLQSAPGGGVPSLRLPSPTSVDPRALADEIRELLGERPVGPILEVDLDPYNTSRTSRPSQASAHLVAAATAAIDWIRARRATWSPLPAGTPAPAEELPAQLEPVFEYAARTRTTPKSVEAWAPPQREAWPPPPPTPEPWAPPARKAERSGTSAASRASAAASQSRDAIVAWLPRVAALAVVAGVVWIGIGYWPRLLATWNSTVTKMQSTSAPSAPAETRPIPGSKPPARGGRASAVAVAPGELGTSGWVAVFSSVEITVSEGNKAIALDDRSQAMLPAGRHRLRFQNRTLGYDETRTVQIKPTETTTLTLTPQTTVGVTSNEPAEVLIDGALVGGTPLKGHRIDLGSHTVVVRAAGGERQISIDATSKPIQLEVDFRRP